MRDQAVVFDMVFKLNPTDLTVHAEYMSAIASSILSYNQAVGNKNSIPSKLLDTLFYLILPSKLK